MSKVDLEKESLEPLTDISYLFLLSTCMSKCTMLSATTLKLPKKLCNRKSLTARNRANDIDVDIVKVKDKDDLAVFRRRKFPD